MRLIARTARTDVEFPRRTAFVFREAMHMPSGLEWRARKPRGNLYAFTRIVLWVA